MLVSPYIHPDEKKVRDWSIDNGGAIIQLTNQVLPAKYKPSGALFDACAEGRLLVVPIPERNGAILHPDPFKSQTDPFKHEKPSREHCLYMNSVAERIAEGHFTVLK